MMKLHFESNLDFQLQAVEAVCDLFGGQEVCRTEFTVTRDPAGSQTSFTFAESGLGIGNRLSLLDDAILRNLKAVQLRNGLLPSDSLDSGDFTVEMETGTGKTYVYLRTIFELNKHYGFTKFVIVVPSVAIKEGVYKSLQITEDHFRALYSGTTFEYFLYDSAKLGQVRNFSTSPQALALHLLPRYATVAVQHALRSQSRPASDARILRTQGGCRCGAAFRRHPVTPPAVRRSIRSEELA